MKTKLCTALLLLVMTSISSFAAVDNEDLKNKSTKETTTSNRILSISDQEQLMKAINEAKTKYQFDSKTFIITKTTQSNASRFALQVEDFLLAKGTKVEAYGTKAMQLKGFTVVKNETCFEIIIGVM